jgi:hypothetical protein
MEFRGVQGVILTTAGDAYNWSGDTSRALHDHQEAFSILSHLETDDPGNVDGRLRLAGASNEVGSMLARLHDLSGATAMYHKALALALPQATASHPNEQALDSSAGSYAELGEVWLRSADNHAGIRLHTGTRPIPGTSAAWEFGTRSKKRGR